MTALEIVEPLQEWGRLLLEYLAAYQGGLLEGAVFGGIALAVWQLCGLMWDKAAPRRSRVQDAGRIREYYPEILGAFLGFSIMSQQILWAILAGVVGTILGRLSKAAFRWFGRRLTEEKKIGEVLMLYDVISIYSAAGYSLHEALSASAYLVSILRRPLLRCIQSWGYGPQRALKKLGEEINVPEGYALSRMLQRAVVIGPAKLADFLKQESATMENIRQHRIEQGLGVRPLVQTLYLVFPGLALMGVGLFPVGYHIAKTIMSIKLT